jgi:CHRD domain
MKTFRIAMAGFIALSLSVAAHVTTSARGNDDRDRGNRLRATLIGYDEVPSVSTGAMGRFRAEIADDEQSIDYTLSYDGIASIVNQSHIHFAQKSVNGVIVVWLCQGATRAPAAVALITPECPAAPGGMVSGTITSANVVAQVAGSAGAAQQINQGELAEVIAAIRAGRAYANLHSSVSPGGEIRGQIRTNDDDHD